MLQQLFLLPTICMATHGHYSIDLIIEYVVAVWVTGPAERLGLYYSHHGLDPEPPELPGMVETFETLIGVSESEFKKRKLLVHALHADVLWTCSNSEDTHNVQSETSVRIVMDIVADMSQRKRKCQHPLEALVSVHAIIILVTVPRTGTAWPCRRATIGPEPAQRQRCGRVG